MHHCEPMHLILWNVNYANDGPCYLCELRLTEVGALEAAGRGNGMMTVGCFQQGLLEWLKTEVKIVTGDGTAQD